MAKESTRSLLKLLERLPTPIVIANPVTGRVLWVNSQLLKLARATHPDQILSKSIFDFVQPAQHGIALTDLAKVAIGQSPPPVIYELRTLDGERAEGHVASVPMLFENQPAMLSFVTDVSDRERMIRELAESEERYRLLLETSSAGVVVVVNDEVVYANQALAEALGLGGAQDLVGRSMYEFIAPEFRKPVRAARREVVLTGVPVPAAPVHLLRPDGGRVPTTAATTRIRWDGEIATQTLMHDFGSAIQEDVNTVGEAGDLAGLLASTLHEPLERPEESSAHPLEVQEVGE